MLRTPRIARLMLLAPLVAYLFGGCAGIGLSLRGGDEDLVAADIDPDGTCPDEGWRASGFQHFDSEGKPDPVAVLKCRGRTIGRHFARGEGPTRQVCWEENGGGRICVNVSEMKVLDKGDGERRGKIVYGPVAEKTDDLRYGSCLYIVRDLVDGAVPKKRDDYKSRYRCFDHEPDLSEVEVAP